MIVRQFRSSYFKIFLILVLIISFYNLFRLFDLDKLTFNALFLPDLRGSLSFSNNAEYSMKAENLHIVTNKVHKHLTEGINNTLFLRQGKFKMPLNFQMIHKRISFNIFPSADSEDDRIWNQMRYVPRNVIESQFNPNEKLILLYNGLGGANNKNFESCPVSKCKVTDDRELAKKADVILWMHNVQVPFHKRPPGQVWAIFLLESPLHTPQFSAFESKPNFQINWTATYRLDSTIVSPYFKYTPYDLLNPPPEAYPLPKKNYALGKSKMVAWFVSNCASLNGRMSVARRLQKHIQVDIYGSCGSLSCPRYQVNDCFNMLNKHYKFYLAFENSNCKEYITEKFFLNGLSNNVIPIVLGASPSDYKRVAPPHSYIHIEDFDTLEKLAEYLKYLNKNDTAYNEYFSWKGYGLVDTNTYFWCRLCMMSHEADRVKTVFKDTFKWWYGSTKNVCIGSQRWKDVKDSAV